MSYPVSFHSVVVLPFAATMAWTSIAGGQPCPPQWSNEFPIGDFDGGVRAFAVFDEGQGDRLFAGGNFTRASGQEGVNRVGRWNGAMWEAVGTGVDGDVNAIVVFDDGGGPLLYVGGRFANAGGQPASKIARWDGTSWTGLSGPLSAASYINALTVFDDGSGDHLYAGGWFTAGSPSGRFAVFQWNGLIWSQVGGDFTRTEGSADIFAMRVHDDGTGAAMYAAGNFARVGGVIMRRIAKWNGLAWSSLLEGLGSSAPVHSVWSLESFDQDGSGPLPPVLYAGGNFNVSGTTSLKGFARWDGAAWSSPGAPPFDYSTGLGQGGPGIGTGVYACGNGPSGAALHRWDGTAYQDVSPGVRVASGTGAAMREFDDGGGPALFCGATAYAAGSAVNVAVARWNAAGWTPAGSASIGNSLVGVGEAIIGWDPDGAGLLSPRVVVGGFINEAGGLFTQGAAAWDGSSWTALTGGLSPGGSSSFTTFAVFDAGAGPELYGGGLQQLVGHANPTAVARWDGNAWLEVGAGPGPLRVIYPHDDGSGPALYAAGFFTNFSGTASNSIARWRNGGWEPVGTGLTGGYVYDLITYGDTGGSTLHAAGGFTTAGGQPAAGIARWDGAGWLPLGSGLTGGAALALATHDPGSGPKLYVAGLFSAAGGVPVADLAVWDGATWTAFPAGLAGGASDILWHDDGSGMALYAAGSITPGNIAKWTGAAWSPLDLGTDGEIDTIASVDLDGPGPQGPSLFATGYFQRAGGQYSRSIARWGCPASVCYPDCNADSQLTVADFGCFQTKFVLGDPYADCTGDGQRTVADFGCFQTKFVLGCP